MGQERFGGGLLRKRELELEALLPLIHLISAMATEAAAISIHAVRAHRRCGSDITGFTTSGCASPVAPGELFIVFFFPNCGEIFKS